MKLFYGGEGGGGGGGGGGGLSKNVDHHGWLRKHWLKPLIAV